jgi:hypothetical protein
MSQPPPIPQGNRDSNKYRQSLQKLAEQEKQCNRERAKGGGLTGMTGLIGGGLSSRSGAPGALGPVGMATS